ncbi:MAG: hypothetical protein ACRD12_21555 [Acidimicrobiales bacterium]
MLVASDDDLREAVRSALARLNLTYAELADQGRRGRFQSEHARITWMAIRDLADPA